MGAYQLLQVLLAWHRMHCVASVPLEQQDVAECCVVATSNFIVDVDQSATCCISIETREERLSLLHVLVAVVMMSLMGAPVVLWVPWYLGLPVVLEWDKFGQTSFS